MPALRTAMEKMMARNWVGFVLTLTALASMPSLAAPENQARREENTPAASARTGPEILMYVMPGCGYCEKLRTVLTARGVSWTELDISSSADAKREFSAKGGLGTPMLVIGDEVIQGLDTTRIDAALSKSGITVR
ncbi:MAG: glutaredoxin family protein [Rhodanobacteraceae bacterium]|nr:glutaredoxin family protein [Rhodanobacteraceae bacterium]